MAITYDVLLPSFLPRASSYEGLVMRTKPVFYAPMQGKNYELVRGIAGTLSATAPTVAVGPFPGMAALRFSASTSDNDSLAFTTDTSYHPGDTFSVGGWFNRQGAGDTGSAPTMLGMGSGDLTVYFPLSGNTNKLTLRKSGTGDIFATNKTFASPYADGWQHVIFRKNAGSSTDCYLNGVSAAGTLTNQTVVAAASNVTFGLPTGSTTNDFDGSMCHWAIWNRVLTEDEVVRLYRGAWEVVG